MKGTWLRAFVVRVAPLSLVLFFFLWGSCSAPPPEDAAEEQAAVDDVSPGEEEEAAAASAPGGGAAASPADRAASAPSPAPEPEPRAPAEEESAPAEEESAPAEEESAPAPRIVEVEVPPGTLLELELLSALDSSVNRVGDEIQARTRSPLYVEGEQVLGSGALVEGRVTEVQASGRVKGRARLGFTFDRLSTGSGVEKIRTSFVEQEAEGGEKKDAAVIGGAAGVGAIVGGIIGGKKGAAIGATVGGAGGTGVVLSTKGEEIRLPVGTELNVRLEDSVTFEKH